MVDPDEHPDDFQIAPDYIEKGTGRLLPCHTVAQNKIRSKNHLFHSGQIIYSKIRPALRKAVIAPFDGLCSADMYPLDTDLNTEFLLLCLLPHGSRHLSEQIIFRTVAKDPNFLVSILLL